jgi:hypothetical protein
MVKEVQTCVPRRTVQPAHPHRGGAQEKFASIPEQKAQRKFASEHSYRGQSANIADVLVAPNSRLAAISPEFNP